MVLSSAPGLNAITLPLNVWTKISLNPVVTLPLASVCIDSPRFFSNTFLGWPFSSRVYTSNEPSSRPTTTSLTPSPVRSQSPCNALTPAREPPVVEEDDGSMTHPRRGFSPSRKSCPTTPCSVPYSTSRAFARLSIFIPGFASASFARFASFAAQCSTTVHAPGVATS